MTIELTDFEARWIGDALWDLTRGRDYDAHLWPLAFMFQLDEERALTLKNEHDAAHFPKV